MHDKPIFALFAFLILVVVAILATGIGGFARGGEWNARNGNRMMRWRLIAQAVALAAMMGWLAFRGA